VVNLINNRKWKTKGKWLDKPSCSSVDLQMLPSATNLAFKL